MKCVHVVMIIIGLTRSTFCGTRYLSHCRAIPAAFEAR